MNQTRAAYLTAARSAVSLIAEPAVVRRWAEPSALDGLRVGGLAAHLGAQILRVPAVLDQPAPSGEPIGLLAHFGRVPWVKAEPDAEVNVVVRRIGAELAEAGPEPLLAQVTAVLAGLAPALADAPADRVVAVPPGGWGLTLDDYLVTRLLEIAVHSDDLAVSVGIDPPELPAEVNDPVFDLLTRLAVRRHGQPAVLRALARAERAPADITAI
ncbi:Mycothiol maleylpyruvate isomerase N-terminal domain-containing protein [Micromonospora pallida]|uniref:Mycothiol maleylpyruvate isomerase N-terminal domain-containing protein n=1 Tax=Micromonospora pallida TaxID=145854 RepID=A0A1C6RJG3_9ACTN|nr:maleylpyruvate isomerase N-terminal domain-containing protein [Micromonospora pallida]SCL17257.1 Mycothiol maleylpyruvate isomerase N-terminal domain-containing protein [Micromonospora pallida]